MQKSTRLKKEIKQLAESPTSGISCWTVGEKIDQLEACMNVKFTYSYDFRYF